MPENPDVDMLIKRDVMKQKAIPLTCLAIMYLLVVTVMDGIASQGQANDMSVHHDLTIVLLPNTSELAGRDRMRIQGSPDGQAELLLAPRTRIQVVRVEGHDGNFTFDKGRLTVNLDRKQSVPTVNLRIDYTCRFDDPAPARPVNTDNPGFGVNNLTFPAPSHPVC